MTGSTYAVQIGKVEGDTVDILCPPPGHLAADLATQTFVLACLSQSVADIESSPLRQALAGLAFRQHMHDPDWYAEHVGKFVVSVERRMMRDVPGAFVLCCRVTTSTWLRGVQVARQLEMSVSDTWLPLSNEVQAQPLTVALPVDVPPQRRHTPPLRLGIIPGFFIGGCVAWFSAFDSGMQDAAEVAGETINQADPRAPISGSWWVLGPAGSQPHLRSSPRSLGPSSGPSPVFCSCGCTD